MTTYTINQKQKKYLVIATILALLVGVWFLKSYIMLIVLAAIVAVLFNPVYQRLVKRGFKHGTAATLTFFITLLAVIIPLFIVGLITVLQVQIVVDKIAEGNYSTQAADFIDSLIPAVNQILSNLHITYQLTEESIRAWLSSALQTVGLALVSGLVSSVSSIFGFITAAIIYIYVFIGILMQQDKLLSTLKNLNPLGDKVSELYTARIGAMTKATVRGQFIIALCQGAASALVLAIAGLDNLFFFFFMILTALSIIPLGAGIVTIPIGLVMILMGNIWQGVLIIVNHLVVVTNIDNILRPQLVPRSAKLDPALMILAVFAGMGYFGFIGIVVGPVIMIALVTTVQLYLEVFRNTQSIDTATGSGEKSLMQRLQFWK